MKEFLKQAWEDFAEIFTNPFVIVNLIIMIVGLFLLILGLTS